MTIRLLDPSHYADVIPNIQNLPQFHFLYPLIKFEGEGLNSGTNLIIYEYSQTVHDKEKKFYLAFKYHKHSNVIVIGNSSYLCGKFEGNAMAELFPVIKDRLLAESLFETVLPEASEKELFRLINEEGTHPYHPLHNGTYLFYIDSNEEKNFLQKEIKIPEGFEIRPLLPEYAQQMMSVLLHYQEGDEDQAAIRLKELPSAAIFEISTNKLAAFEYNDGIGSIAHQYVYPEYRGIGLGKAVEILICQRNIQHLKILAAKCVALARPKVLLLTEKAGFWTKLLDANGNPAQTWWTIYSKIPKEKIIICDN